MSRKQVHKHFQRRRSGVLLHPTSFPAASTEGALGNDAYRFIQFLADSGFTIWQMLPVNTTDDHGSPYQGTSVHAGNPRLISLRNLAEKNWLPAPLLPDREVQLMRTNELIAEARKGFENIATEQEREQFRTFRQEHSTWLEDYALFSALTQQYDSRPWWQWPAEIRRREGSALAEFKQNHNARLEDYYFEQYIFYHQWAQLRKKANDNGILLFGDLPIFVAHNSVDVWTHPEYFQLDEKGRPKVVAGVPPDYFSPTGQRWGNPLYLWSRMEKNNFQWWIDRLHTQFRLFDLVRLDHFRGFISLWEIPVHSETAEHGRWQSVPGRRLFEVLRQEFGDLPLVAEDLGTISREVLELRDDFNLPGMKVLVFAFDSEAKNPYLPHNHEPDSIVYTGTHDNNTTLGWFNNLPHEKQQRVLEYLQYPDAPMPWPLIHTALQSICRFAILPMQDILGLDGSHRMNTPGTLDGNWRWQFQWEWVSSDLATRMRHLNNLYDRT